jgi:hypothetical protein
MVPTGDGAAKMPSWGPLREIGGRLTLFPPFRFLCAGMYIVPIFGMVLKPASQGVVRDMRQETLAILKGRRKEFSAPWSGSKRHGKTHGPEGILPAACFICGHLLGGENERKSPECVSGTVDGFRAWRRLRQEGRGSRRRHGCQLGGTGTPAPEKERQLREMLGQANTELSQMVYLPLTARP